MLVHSCDFDWDFGLEGEGGDQEECRSRRLSPPGWQTEAAVDYTPLLRPQHTGGDMGGEEPQVVLSRNREADSGERCGAEPSGLCYNRPARRATHNVCRPPSTASINRALSFAVMHNVEHCAPQLNEADDLCAPGMASAGVYDDESKEEDEEEETEMKQHRPLMARATVGASMGVL